MLIAISLYNLGIIPRTLSISPHTDNINIRKRSNLPGGNTGLDTKATTALTGNANVYTTHIVRPNTIKKWKYSEEVIITSTKRNAAKGEPPIEKQQLGNDSIHCPAYLRT